MSSSRRMQPIADMATQRARDAARELSESQRQLDQQKDQYAQLVAYREEYMNRLQDMGSRSFSAIQLINYDQFLARLASAIEQQQAALESAQEDTMVCRDKWMGVQQKADALEKVVKQHVRREEKEKEQREQNQSDDFGQRIGQHKRM